MKIAAYCRVSTEQRDQLNSLDAQKKFFTDYTEKNGHHLVKLYADEGLSGTKIKNRTQFQAMMRDAKSGLFEMVVVKDISRLARNTVDLLQSVRTLKALGIDTVFVNYNMNVIGNSELVLTMMGAVAQEESSNTSKRVKFGKQLNAEKGRVPNIVYGYDKTIGDYFNLTINPREASAIAQMFHWYIQGGYGTAKIAKMLNEKNIPTKRNNQWSQNAVCRVLQNELYTGKIINGKEEVADFLTGARQAKDSDQWMITDRPDLRIIQPEVFDTAKNIMKSRGQAFRVNGQRQSNLHLFSTLIKCKDCGWSFRRTVRQYKNTYIRWVCSGHNGKGAASCPNAIAIDEAELITVLQDYFNNLLAKKKHVMEHVVSEFMRVYKAKNENLHHEKEIADKLAKLQRTRQKYMDMYTDELISRKELGEKIGGMMKEISHLEQEQKLIASNLSKGDQLESILSDTFKTLEDISDVSQMTNTQLKRIIQKIEIDHGGNVDIHLRLLGELGLPEFILIDDNHT